MDAIYLLSLSLPARLFPSGRQSRLQYGDNTLRLHRRQVLYDALCHIALIILFILCIYTKNPAAKVRKIFDMCKLFLHIACEWIGFKVK